MRFIAVVVCLTGLLYAQGDRGTITGTVADPAGAVVPSAPVVVKHLDTGSVYQAATSTTGNFTLSQLPAGVYELSVSVSGFKKYQRTGITVNVAQVIRIDVPLEVGATTEVLNVTEDAPLLKTESGELSHTVTTERLDDLPILGIGSQAASTYGLRNP